MNKRQHGHNQKNKEFTNTLGIVCALKVEAEALLPWLPVPETFRFQKRSWMQSFYGNTKLIIVISKPGGKNAERATQLLIENHFPQWVINFGSAGAISPDMEIGDIVLATSTAEYTNPSPRSDLIETSGELWHLAQYIPEIRTGPIVSAEQNIDSENLKTELFQRYKALCGDWESAVVMRVCRDNQIPAIAFRAITDWGNDNLVDDFMKNHVAVLENASHVLKTAISQLLKTDCV